MSVLATSVWHVLHHFFWLMRERHSRCSWLKLMVAAASVAGNTRIGMFTRLILRYPFHVGRAAIMDSLQLIHYRSIDGPEPVSLDHWTNGPLVQCHEPQLRRYTEPWLDSSSRSSAALWAPCWSLAGPGSLCPAKALRTATTGSRSSALIPAAHGHRPMLSTGRW